MSSTPVGSPAVPEVWIRHWTASVSKSVPSSASGASGPAVSSEGSSTTRAGSTLASSRSTARDGARGSMGTATAPSFVSACRRTAASAVGSAVSATRSPGRTPAAATRRAVARASRSSSAKDRSVSPAISAGRCGSASAARASQSSTLIEPLGGCGWERLSCDPPMDFSWAAAGSYTDIRYETGEGDAAGIAKITIARPEVRNAFRPETVIELSSAFEAARDDPEVGVIVLTGEGR